MISYPPQGPQKGHREVDERKPWGLIFGLSFGVILNVIWIPAYFLYIAPLWFITITASVSAESSLIVFALIVLYLLCSALPGYLTARRTHRAGSGWNAGLFVSLTIIVGVVIIELVGTLTASLGLKITIIEAGLVSLPMCAWLGFIGGLAGGAATPAQQMVGRYFLTGSLCAILASFGILYPATSENPGYGMLIAVIFGFVAIICGFWAWIIALIHYYRIQSWGRFTLTIFFSGIMVMLYLAYGAEPDPVVQTVGGYPPLQSPVQPDAVSILQQRYARGEIDEATYQRMLTMLNQPR